MNTSFESTDNRCDSILSDMDGVIVNTEEMRSKIAAKVIWNKYAAALFAQGKREEDLHELIRIHLKGKPFSSFFIKFVRKLSLPKNGMYMETLEDHTRGMQEYLDSVDIRDLAVPGTVEFLQAAARRKCKIALVTGSREAEAKKIVRAFDLEKLLSRDPKGPVMITADTTGTSGGKPQPHPYEIAIRRLFKKNNPEQCLGIEDADVGDDSLLLAGVTNIVRLVSDEEAQVIASRQVPMGEKVVRKCVQNLDQSLFDIFMRAV
jgi:beta-phosphoglucomutase-like phosphatase (HAD superfamily)